MNVQRAAQRTVDSFVAAVPRQDASTRPKATLAHLRWMNDRIQSSEVSGEKAHRWLGWMQAVVYLGGRATIEQLKQVNFES